MGTFGVLRQSGVPLVKENKKGTARYERFLQNRWFCIMIAWPLKCWHCGYKFWYDELDAGRPCCPRCCSIRISADEDYD